MQETLNSWMRTRARDLGLSLSELCRRAGMSRQTLYDLADVPDKLPSLQTVMALADVLKVHPLKILHLMFDGVPMSPMIQRRAKRGDRSVFVRDVTAPDGELLLPGQRFTKIWEVQNVGQVPWEGRYLQCMDDEIVVASRSGEVLHLAQNLIPAVQRIAVPVTQPGDTVQLSVDFTTPNSPGTVLSYWKTVFEDGSHCFPKSAGVWVKVRVSSMTSGAFEVRK